MSTPLLLEDVSFHAGLVKTLADKAAIDPPSNLVRSRVYIFTDGSDSVVSSETVENGSSTPTRWDVGIGGDTPTILST